MSIKNKPKLGFGFIYILSHPSMPSVYKIGLTTNSVHQRIQELNTTGLPKSFRAEKIFEIREIHLRSVEQHAHKKLKNKDLHHGKEFFKCDISECVEAVEDSILKITDELSEELIGRAKERAELEKKRREREKQEYESRKSRLNWVNQKIDEQRAIHITAEIQKNKRDTPFFDRFLWEPLGIIFFSGFIIVIAVSIGPYGWILAPIVLYWLYKHDKNETDDRLKKSAEQKYPYKNMDNFEDYEAVLKKSQKENYSQKSNAKSDSQTPPNLNRNPSSIKKDPSPPPKKLLKVWYRTSTGIGHKLSETFIPYADTLRSMVPIPGYEIRKSNFVLKNLKSNFIKDDEIDIVRIIDNEKVIVSCPGCANDLRIGLFKHAEIACPSCKIVWRQKL